MCLSKQAGLRWHIDMKIGNAFWVFWWIYNDMIPSCFSKNLFTFGTLFSLKRSTHKSEFCIHPCERKCADVKKLVHGCENTENRPTG